MADEFLFDVFLSHSTKDKPIVREIAARLQADGLRVWFDEGIIMAGDSIPAKIEEGLEQSRVLVLCMSAQAFDSDWAQLESHTYRFKDPLNKKRRFIPLRLDKADIKGSLAQLKYIDWLSEEREQEYAKLLKACQPPTMSARLPVAEKAIYRGFEWAGLLYYFLLRLPHYSDSDMEVVLQSEEDAQLLYRIQENAGSRQITEYLQCEKRASSDFHDGHAEAVSGDEWRAGKVTAPDLLAWVSKTGHTPNDLLSGKADTFFTALVFGEIAPDLQGFLPHALRDGTQIRTPQILQSIKPDYLHHTDPAARLSALQQAAALEVRNKIRLIPLPSPQELDFRSCRLLRDYFQVSEVKAQGIFEKLLWKIAKLSTGKDAANRRLTAGEVRKLISEGVAPKGSWQDSNNFLKRSKKSLALSTLREPIIWAEFANNSYYHFTEYDEAWKILQKQKIIIVCGPVGDRLKSL